MGDQDLVKVKFEIPNFTQKAITRAVQDSFIKTAEYTRDQWIKNLEEYDLVLSRNMIDSIIIEIKDEHTVILRSDETKAPYLIYHEFGAGPSHEPDPHSKYWPSREALLKWVKARKLRWRDKKGRFMSHQKIVSILMILQHERGILPKPCARPAFEKGRKESKKIVNEMMYRRFVKGETNKSNGRSNQKDKI